jgi:hypothetical protein
LQVEAAQQDSQGDRQDREAGFDEA